MANKSIKELRRDRDDLIVKVNLVTGTKRASLRGLLSLANSTLEEREELEFNNHYFALWHKNTHRYGFINNKFNVITTSLRSIFILFFSWGHWFTHSLTSINICATFEAQTKT